MGKKGTKMTKCERVPGLKPTTAAAAAEKLWRAANPKARIRRARCSKCVRPWPFEHYERHAESGRRMKLCPRCQWASRLNEAEKGAVASGEALPDRATFQPAGLPHYNPFTAEVLPPGPGVHNDRHDTPVEPEHVAELCGGPEIPFPGGVPGSPLQRMERANMVSKAIRGAINETNTGSLAPPHAQEYRDHGVDVASLGQPRPGKIKEFVNRGVDFDPDNPEDRAYVALIPTFNGKLTLAEILTESNWTADDVIEVASAMRSMVAFRNKPASAGGNG